MLSKLNVRSKLLVMVMPALVGMSVLAVMGVQSRLEDQSAAEARRNVVAATRTASSFLHEVQRERVMAVTRAVVERSVPKSTLRQQMDRTDAAGTAALTALRDLDVSSVHSSTGDNPAQQQAQLVGLIGSLADARGNADADPEELVSGYDSLAGGLVQVIGNLELAVSGGDATAVGRHWLSAGIEAQTAAAAQAAQYFAGDADLATTIAQLSGKSQLFIDEYAQFTGAGGRDALRRAEDLMAFDISVEPFEQLSTPEGVADFSADATTWPNVVSGRLGALQQVESANYAAEMDRLDDAAATAQRDAKLFAAAAAATLLLVTLLAFVVSRGITTALRRLTDAARDITTDRLPALVEAMKTGTMGREHLEFAEVDTHTRDEFAEVATALNDLGRATVDVAAEQHRSLQKGIGEIFVNLARRNQSLLERQIQFIDVLESNEQDADQLEHLFKLDHLATRMRRNAESLLVLAGAEVQKRRTREISMSDVIRIAIGEVEDFARVRLAAVDEARVHGGAGADLSHLLSELMENGTQYSPPERTVGVVGHLTRDGNYVVTVSDSGVGMDPARLAAANELLASPPPVGLALSRSLGFVVAATLAARHGIAIRLSSSGAGGVSAEVVVPAALIAVDAPLVLTGAFEPEDLAGFSAADISVPAPFGRDSQQFGGESPAFARPMEAPVAQSQSALEAPTCGWTLDGEYIGPADAWDDFMQSGPPPFDPAQFEPAQFERAQSERAQFEPAQFEPAQFEPVQFGSAPSDGDPSGITWGEETVPAAPSPTHLSDAVPTGASFDRGLDGLLGISTPAAPADAAAPPMPLPQRRPGATAASFDTLAASRADASMAPQTRAPEEVRSVLSQYRSGLVSGRTANEAEDTTPGGDR